MPNSRKKRAWPRSPGRASGAGSPFITSSGSSSSIPTAAPRRRSPPRRRRARCSGPSWRCRLRRPTTSISRSRWSRSASATSASASGTPRRSPVARSRKLELWARHCPDNFRVKLVLVLAEAARAAGRDVEAMGLYDDAIDAARQSEFVQYEALASELAGLYYARKGAAAHRHALPGRGDARLPAVWGKRKATEPSGSTGSTRSPSLGGPRRSTRRPPRGRARCR